MAQRLRVVVDHEERWAPLRSRDAGPAGAAREGAGAGRLGYREREGEAGARGQAAALGPDAPAVSLDQALADGKSQPAADLAVAVPGGDVFAEELPEALRRDAPSLVCNRDRDMHPVAFRSDPDGSGVRAVVRGVSPRALFSTCTMRWRSASTGDRPGGRSIRTACRRAAGEEGVAGLVTTTDLRGLGRDRERAGFDAPGIEQVADQPDHAVGMVVDTLQGADEIILDLYKRMPEVRITDILMDVNAATGFTDAFTHLRTGVPCKDKIGLLNVLLAEGINLGLSKMAEATNTHDYWKLMRLSRWHVESEALNRALAMVVEAQAKLPMAAFWGMGTTASSDGQFFSTTRQGEAMNLINAKYGREPGLKAYTHVSDQFAPFAIQTIPATVSEAPYILDGLLMNETGKRIREQYADTGGFTDHVFAVTSILGYQFIPRIRDLPSKRLYVFDPRNSPKELRGLLGGKIREGLITSNWPDILRIAATMTAGTIAPSQILRKLASYPRQNDLAAALREIGRVERTLFMIDWILDADMQRRAQIGLNKGESHHALKNALRIGRQGEIRDRTTEGQHYRMAGLNLLTAIVIYWNTVRLGEAVNQRKRAGLPTPPELLAHTSPLGWAHILLTGEYRWSKKR